MIALFAVIGAMRGSARELLVTFSAILSLFIISIFEHYVPVIGPLITQNASIQFWTRTIVFVLLIIFGYQTPNLPIFNQEKSKPDAEKVPDTLLGLFIGILNGYLIFGTLWYFLDQANYPFSFILEPSSADPIGQAAIRMISFLPPQWLVPPLLYIVLAIFAVFIIVNFI
jgi:hypothetical protein